MSDVRARFVEGSPGAGQRYATIVLTNNTTSPCTIYGYGGMQLESSSGRVPTNLKRIGSAPRTITLIPNGSASSRLHWGAIPVGSEENNGSNCEPLATSALVTPPDETHSLTVAWNFGPVCDKGHIDQDAYVPGTGG